MLLTNSKSFPKTKQNLCTNYLMYFCCPPPLMGFLSLLFFPLLTFTLVSAQGQQCQEEYCRKDCIESHRFQFSEKDKLQRRKILLNFSCEQVSLNQLWKTMPSRAPIRLSSLHLCPLSCESGPPHPSCRPQ